MGSCMTTDAWAVVSQVASEMSELIKSLRDQELLAFIPPFSAGCILTAMTSHLVEIRLSGKLPVDIPDHPYHECGRALLTLRGVWPITKGTCAMVKQMETNKQVWFARNLKMLAEPTPNEFSADEDDLLPENVSPATYQSRPATVDHPLDCVITNNESIVPRQAHTDYAPPQVEEMLDEMDAGNNWNSTCFAAANLETMFSMFSADFDVFGSSSDAHELFTEDYTSSSLGVGLCDGEAVSCESASGAWSTIPSTLPGNVNVAATQLERWRS